nr:macroglobulin-complement related protein-like 3 [Arenicola marina]
MYTCECKMQMFIQTLLILGIIAANVLTVTSQPENLNGYRLPNLQEFLVLAPKTVRPMQTYEMHVTLFRLHYSDVTVRAVLSNDGVEYATSQEIFYDKGTKRLQLMVPETVMPGKHKLSVQGLVSGGRGDPIFHNETALVFDSKYISLFIQTEKPVYYPPQEVTRDELAFSMKAQGRFRGLSTRRRYFEAVGMDDATGTVNFRIVGVTPDLKPVHGRSITIYVKDGHGNIVRRWLNRELNFGMYEGNFSLSYPVQPGTWNIMVDAYGHKYEHPFQVQYFFRRVFEVNVTTPLYIFDTDWGLMGSVYSEHLSGLAGFGNVTLSLRVRNEEGIFLPNELNRTIAYIKGTTQFSYSMAEILDTWGDVNGKELVVKCWYYDWYFLTTQNGTSTTKVIKDGIVIKSLGRKFRSFKPEVPFSVYFAVLRTDGTPYKGFYNRQVLVQISHSGDGASKQYDEKLVIPSDSVVRYEIRPRAIDRHIKITASHIPTDSPVEIWCYRYFSRNDRYISVTTSTEVPKTNEYMTFTVRTNFFVEEINYLISAGGNVLLGSLLTMNSQQKTFAVALSRQMAPRARIMVYTVEAGEILMDTLNFFVRDSRLYNASLTINYGKDFTEQSIELIGRGDPGAFFAIQGIDYEWYRRGADSFLDEEKIVSELMTYDDPYEGPYQHIWNLDSESWEKSVFFTAPTGGIDTLTTLNASGLVALSDMNMTIKQEYTSCNRSMGVGICLDGSCYDLAKTCDGWPDCFNDGFDEMNCPMQDWELPQRREPDIKNLHYYSRYFFDFSWSWRTTYVKPIGQVEMKLDIPESTNPMVFSGFVLHPDLGLSLVRQDAQHDTTKRFYMVAECPRAVKRGEQIGIRLALFNNWDQDIEAIVTLHGGEDYRFIFVEDFGYVNSYNPRLPVQSGDVQVMVEMEAGEQKYLMFPVCPIIETGQITVQLSAISPINRDFEEITIEIGYDGVGNDDFIPFLVDLNNKGSLLAPYFDIPIPQQFMIPDQRELLYIPGSNNAVVDVFGDVVSPGFFEDYLSADNTAGVPHDSAEGYMYDYAINLQTLQYLENTRALDKDSELKVLEYMKTILMRQYAYMAEDGSFAQFRRFSKPCVWVTSFVLQNLHATLESQWSEEVYIPLEILNKITTWLVAQQNETGAFHETSDEYYDRNFLPFSTDADGVIHEWHIPVTAQVVITLSYSSRLTGEAKTLADQATEQAAAYLSTKIAAITDPFQMAITAYALQAAAHKTRDEAFNKLRNMNRSDENTYWAGIEIPPNEFEIINTMYYMKPRGDFLNLENAVMATSYAMMLYLQHNELQKSLPIMRWLVTQRMGTVAWSSTKDTLLALKALSAFALEESNREFFNIEIRLESTSDSSWKPVSTVNRTNFYELQQYELDHAWGNIKAILQGTGYAFIGVTSAFNCEKPWLLNNPDYETFDFGVENLVFSGRNASSLEMTVCSRVINEDLSPRIGMTFAAIELPTGFIVNRDEVERLYLAGVPGLRRVRFRDQTLIIFFDYMTTEKTCFTFAASRWYPVANVSINHFMGIFEYAETGMQAINMYDTYTLFHLHICQVCGSFQCPYCQYYNGAPRAVTSPPLSVFLGVLAMTQLVVWATIRRIAHAHT